MSAFSALVVCILPITEVIFSVFRRQVRKDNLGKPDRLHFHSILQRRYITRWFTHWPHIAKNSMVGMFMGSTNLVSAVVAIYFYESTLYCVIASFIFALGYVAIFARMVRHSWFSPISFLIRKPIRLPTQL